MQKDGLITREPNPADARSTLVCLLPVGRAAIEKAAQPRAVQHLVGSPSSRVKSNS
jgi:DNA-binding MarR family transcriptional regulator